METELENLLFKIRLYSPQFNSQLVQKAYHFAKLAHEGQKRKSGEPVFNHLLACASGLADWKLDSISVAAGLLHDTIEDTKVTKEEVEKEFGDQVARIVDGVTKISAIKLQGKTEENFVENLRKMILVMAQDLRVVLVKLSDRHHNMQTLSYLPKVKQERIARETLEVYAPLAERLGIGEMKGELEDLSFPYIHPKEFKKIKNFSNPYFLRAKEHLEEARSAIDAESKRANLCVKVNGRAKHLYSLWRKLGRKEINRDITKIYDLVALRILVESVRDCYAALGIVHKIWKPVPFEGVSDFIAVPKPNGYRSIHTKVFGPQGRITEVQIRTYQMHEEAENGIAAHWYYAHSKEKGGASDRELTKGVFTPDEKLSWVKQLVGWQKEMVDSSEFLSALKFDALRHRIFVFSPKGDVYDLPQGATPIDFAYSVHTDLGNCAMGAKVNGKMAPLDYHLKSGEMVEIIVGKNKKLPSRDWRNFVVTHTARKEIARHSKKA